jgi:RNA polymerase-binding transcription factor DksA
MVPRHHGAVSTPETRLQAERAGTLRSIAALRGDVAAIVDSASSTSGDDEHDPEGATIGFERAQAQSLLARAEARLVELDAALQRTADGSYGTCARCGRPIPAERLDARPEATLCVACAARRR